MTITLLALSLNDSPLTQPITATFDPRGGTIGRADHNTMALPDPERHISRLQAEVRTEGQGYTIKNVGAANPISVGNRQLAAGETCPLTHGDTLRIGGYLLRVLDDAQGMRGSAGLGRSKGDVDDLVAVSTSPGVARPRPVASAGLPVSGPPQRPSATPDAQLRDLGMPLSSDNPFADLLGEPPMVRPADGEARRLTAVGGSSDPFADLLAPPAGVAENSAALGSSATKPSTPVLPDDFDPFAAPVRPAPEAPPDVPQDPFADLRPNRSPETIDQLFDLGSGGGANEALGRFEAGLPPEPGSRRTEGGVPTDPLELFGEIPTPAGPAEAQALDHTSDLHAAFEPPLVTPSRPAMPAAGQAEIPTDVTWLRPRPSAAAVHQDASPPDLPPSPSTPPPAHSPPLAVASAPAPLSAEPPAVPVFDQPRTAAQASHVRHDDLWQAFCEGAGIQVELPHGLDEQTMRSIGQVLQAAVAGTLQLIAVRASTKQEMRADVTMIQARSNNPLKFAPDAQTGVEQLLSPPMRGFLPGPAAMQDAMADLVGHSIGTVAGMRAALEGVLDRFAPEQLEAKLSGKSLLDSLLPMNRKARLWDLYRQHFEAIRDDAQEDFHALFGKAFLAAYEQQVERLKATRDAR